MRSTKRVLNLHEEATHQRLRKVSDAWGASVFPKVCVADVLNIESSGIEADLFRFALSSHFDFVVTDDNFEPAFTVEFDGPHHSDTVQVERDKKKDKLCQWFDFPLLRINSSYLPRHFGEMDLLSWFATAWFCEREHARLQREGKISHDDIFDPRFVVSSPGLNSEYPLWISRKVLGRLRRLFFEGKVADFTHSVVVIEDDKGCIKSLAWLLLDLESGVISRTAFTPKLFKVGLVEAAEQIAVFGLGEEVRAALDGDAEPLPRGEIERLISEFANSGRMRFGFSGGNLGLPSSRGG